MLSHDILEVRLPFSKEEATLRNLSSTVSYYPFIIVELLVTSRAILALCYQLKSGEGKPIKEEAISWYTPDGIALNKNLGCIWQKHLIGMLADLYTGYCSQDSLGYMK